jgi:hypothetical protein
LTFTLDLIVSATKIRSSQKPAQTPASAQFRAAESCSASTLSQTRH